MEGGGRMDRRQRAMLCMMVQLMAAWAMLCIRGWTSAPEVAAAFAEEGSFFTAEVVHATAVPTETPAPTQPPEATATPAPTVSAAFHVEVIRTTQPPQPWAGKRVLIYHTHTYEAYEQDPDAPYRETEKWRTKDERCNMLAVGEALAAHLRALGLIVVHDRTAFEPPDLDDAYSRSLTMLEARLAAGERYDLYIDVHRDALSAQSTIRRTVAAPGGESARFMVLVGKGNTGGYSEKPDWEANRAIAQRITAALNAQVDGLARDVKIKTGRFNQHIAPCCVLIECGVNTNTLEQVLCGLPYLAQAIAQALAE